MKRILKKNQVVLTLLAVMIAVAGYLNYTADTQAPGAQMASGEGDSTGALSHGGELLDISDEDILAENQALSAALQETFDGSDDAQGVNAQSPDTQASDVGDPSAENSQDSAQNTGSDTPGTAVFTSGTGILDYVAGVQLSREQTRARNKETLMKIIENANLEEAQKQEAIEAMLDLTAVAEKETAAESLLAAKGFENSIVYINDQSVDVVICRTALTDAERAQIEDIVKRKAEVTADKIVITLLELEE